MLRDLEIRAKSIEGARVLFENLILDLVKIQHKSAKKIRASNGDWGIDIIFGQLTSGMCIIWQAKYFNDKLGDSQKAQIRESFNTLLEKSKEKNFIVDVWYLCLPISLSPTETIWWEKWSKKKMSTTGIRILLMDEGEIENLLYTPDAKYILLKYFDTKDGLLERDIVKLSNIDSYNSSIFIKKLFAAQIKEVLSAKTQFFNAELIKEELKDKGDDTELAELTNLYEKIRSIWESNYNEFCSDSTIKNQSQLYLSTLKEIKMHDKGILNSPRIRASFIHKQGFMHQLANVCDIGWTINFRDVDWEGD